MTTSQHEILTPAPLLDADGRLTAAGWSRQPLLDCNLENTHFYGLKFLQPLRIKRWDYYAIFTPDHFFSFTVSDIGYLGMIFAYVLDFKTAAFQEETVAVPFANGVQLPRNSQEGTSAFDNGKVSLRFSVENGLRRLQVDWPQFGKTSLAADLSLACPRDHESMTIVIPIEQKRFYYNRKINCMPASGWVRYGENEHTLNPQTSLGQLDWGRGVWAYSSFWLWASTSGFLPDGRTIGLNMGYGFGDTSAASENAFLLDGKVHKLGTLRFEYDPQHFMKPWRMKDEDGRLDLTFAPFYERVAKTDLKILNSEVHQMFGRYRGKLITDGGEQIIIEDLVGFAEEHHAKW
jgi:hypothetical protein